jgi:hypothetical protein
MNSNPSNGKATTTCLVLLVIATLGIALLFKLGFLWIGRRDYGANFPVPNNRIVLVKQGRNYGALVLTDQSLNPVSVKYEWFYRDDGKGVFAGRNQSPVRHGVGNGISSHSFPGLVIEFGPCRVNWSAKDSGWGWIYYSRYAGEPIGSGDIRICVTGETDIGKINAADPKWLYKASPTDKGIRSSGLNR